MGKIGDIPGSHSGYTTCEIGGKGLVPVLIHYFVVGDECEFAAHVFEEEGYEVLHESVGGTVRLVDLEEACIAVWWWWRRWHWVSIVRTTCGGGGCSGSGSVDVGGDWGRTICGWLVCCCWVMMVVRV